MNVLFMICDDLNNAISGMGRTPFAPTPNLRRLMDGGVRFPHAYSNCPICLPSRSSLFSGLYPHNTGHFTLWDNWRTCTPIAPTAMHTQPDWGRALLRDAAMMPLHFLRNGYQVFGAGKTLHEGRVDEAWWTEYSGGPDYGPAIHGPIDPRIAHLFEGNPFEDYVRRYRGLDRMILDGDRFRFHAIETATGPLDEYFGPDAKERMQSAGCAYRYANDDDRDSLPDEKTAAYGVEVLGRRHDKPFFLALGFMKPHTPLNAPRRFFDMFPPETLTLPPYLENDLDDCARALIENCPYGFLRFGLILKEGEAGWRRWLQAYLACVAFVDEQIGRVLDALDHSPYRDDTLVVFTSDNGYHMGEKSYVFKNTVWEEGAAVPLIMRGPGGDGAGQACQTPVSLIDIYPTLIDLCGLPPHPNVGGNERALDGHSLRPLLQAPAAGRWDGPPVALSSVRQDTGIHHSVRSATHRYTLCQNGEEEFYDHRTDSHEWHNLVRTGAQADVKTALRAELLKLLFAG